MSEYKLVGMRNEHEYGYGGWTGNVTQHEDVVATFSTREKAEQYVEDSILKSTLGYRQASVLFGCYCCEIVGPEDADQPEIPPHDPEI